MSREAPRHVLVDGRLVLRPDVENARFEGTLTLSHEQFLKEKQIDIKLVAGAGYGLFLASRNPSESSSQASVPRPRNANPMRCVPRNLTGV